jgi:hypothetical protein
VLLSKAQNGDGTVDDPTPLVASERSAILRRGLSAIRAMWANQLDAATLQASPQRIAVIGPVGDYSRRLLPWPPRTMGSIYADRREGDLRELDLCRGCRVKGVSHPRQ